MATHGDEMASEMRHAFNRRLWGYRRSDVDSHLEALATTIDQLRATLDEHDRRHADLVVRATRLSVASVLADAHRRAGEIVAVAEVRAIDLRRAEDVIDLGSVAEPVGSV